METHRGNFQIGQSVAVCCVLTPNGVFSKWNLHHRHNFTQFHWGRDYGVIVLMVINNIFLTF